MPPPTEPVCAAIVNYNGGERLLSTVAALVEQPAPLTQVIVVDNGSDDGSAERVMARFPQVRLVPLGENRGLPAARNVALKTARSDLVLLLDADVYVEPDCVRVLIEALWQTAAAVVCPRVILLPERNVVQCDGADPHFIGTMSMRHAYQPLAALPVERQDVGGCIGACMLLDRAAVLDAGGFDERYFFYFEDLEFSLRMRALDMRIVCDARAVVLHDRAQGTPGLSFRGRGSYPARRAYFTIRHRLLTLFTHYRARTLFVLAPALLLYEVATLGIVVLRGWTVPYLRAWSWCAANLRGVLRQRRWIQRRRRLNDRDILVGGALPIAPGFTDSAIARRALSCLSAALDAYWRLTHRLMG